jgi:hypothetical protein
MPAAELRDQIDVSAFKKVNGNELWVDSVEKETVKEYSMDQIVTLG